MPAISKNVITKELTYEIKKKKKRNAIKIVIAQHSKPEF